MVRPHQVNPCTPSRHISLNFFMPATQATHRMCLLTAWCVRLLRSDCKSMRNWWVYEHLSPTYAVPAGSLQAYAFYGVSLGTSMIFLSKKTHIFKTKFKLKLNKLLRGFKRSRCEWRNKKINNLWGNKFQFSLQPRLQTPTTIIIIFIIKIAP